MRRRPVRDAATEVETLAIEARELIAQLKSDGLEFSLEIPGAIGNIVQQVKVKVKLGSDEPGE